ncbi:hypothetical protein PIB30_000517 [Stylosanthes scabra]|uniref:Uncharacterized protein n=1 Tax=Stylosanthes scabra TaxID=79078 RepID=A0ABU6W435_9FABA|nr:hypothetical protein [Stylosanthes scabra]
MKEKSPGEDRNRGGNTNPIRGYPTISNPFGSGCQPYPQRNGLACGVRVETKPYPTLPIATTRKARRMDKKPRSSISTDRAVARPRRRVDGQENSDVAFTVPPN